jgi:hypothetical protein
MYGKKAASLGAAMVALYGCSSGSPAMPGFPSDAGVGAQEDAVGADQTASPVADAGAAATFTEVYTQIINGPPDCNGCHGPPVPTGDLDMSSQATAYANLVRKHTTAAPKCAAETDLLVDPGNASESVIYLKVTVPPCGSQMPLGGPSLTAPQVELIKSWINASAPNN